MRWKELIINDHAKCEATYAESLAYLTEHPEFHEKLTTHIRAYHEIGNLIPQTLDNIASGHYFPYTQSYFELENSFELVKQGFYNYALIALRSVLELSLLAVYFAVRDQEHIDVQSWIHSKEKTPNRKQILGRLNELPAFRQFNMKHDFSNRIFGTFDALDKYVHTRGYRHSSQALNLANFNKFSDKSFKLYFELMIAVVNDSIIIFLLKYPIGMQKIDLDSKYGFNGPVGGFLQAHQVSLITSLLQEEENVTLEEISSRDKNVQAAVEYFDSLPDLTQEEWNKQADEMEAITSEYVWKTE